MVARSNYAPLALKHVVCAHILLDVVNLFRYVLRRKGKADVRNLLGFILPNRTKDSIFHFLGGWVFAVDVTGGSTFYHILGQTVRRGEHLDVCLEEFLLGLDIGFRLVLRYVGRGDVPLPPSPFPFPLFRQEIMVLCAELIYGIS